MERGFFSTGDLGWVSSEVFMTNTGRKKDLIIRGGENLSPREIEDALMSHPAVSEVAVVSMPHARLGETPCAFVVIRAGHSLDLAGATSHVETIKLAKQKYPERLIVVDALPKTASGKILKQVLRERLSGNPNR